MTLRAHLPRLCRNLAWYFARLAGKLERDHARDLALKAGRQYGNLVASLQRDHLAELAAAERAVRRPARNNIAPLSPIARKRMLRGLP